MIVYYKEERPPFGTQYISINTETQGYNGYGSTYDAIASPDGSVSGVLTGVSNEHIKLYCKRVAKKDVPKEWLEVLQWTNIK